MSHIILSAKQLATIAVAVSGIAPTPRTVNTCKVLENASRHNLGDVTAAQILDAVQDEENDFERSTATLLKGLNLINSLAYNMGGDALTLRELLRMSTTIGTELARRAGDQPRETPQGVAGPRALPRPDEHGARRGERP